MLSWTVVHLCIVMSLCFSHINVVLFTVIRVGYEDTRYSVSERGGFVELCVVTQNPAERDFTLISTTLNGAAGTVSMALQVKLSLETRFYISKSLKQIKLCWHLFTSMSDVRWLFV